MKIGECEGCKDNPVKVDSAGFCEMCRDDMSRKKAVAEAKKRKQ